MTKVLVEWRTRLHRMVLRILYPAYRRFNPSPFRFSKRVTPAGWMVFGALGLTAVMGIDMGRTRLFQLAALFFGFTLVGMVSGLFFRPRMRGKRELPANGSVGVPLQYVLDVENRGGVCTSCSFQENPRIPRPAFERFVGEREPGEESRNAWDRFFVFYRWVWLLDRLRPMETKRSQVVDVPRRGRVRVDMEVVPLRRGVLALGDVAVLRGDLFGLRLVKRRVRTECAGEVVVLPRRYDLPEIDLEGNSPYQEGGAAASRRLGRDDDFVGLRDYEVGDPLRTIHWKTWARTGRPVVKEYVEEYTPRYALVLDTYSLADPFDLFEAAVEVAASFAVRLDQRESLLDMMFVGNELYSFTSGRGQTMTRRLLELLAGVDLSSDPKGLDLLEQSLMMRSRSLSACVFVLLDWDEPRKRLVDLLRKRGCPVEVLVMCAPDDSRLSGDAAGRVRFMDVTRLAEGFARW